MRQEPDVSPIDFLARLFDAFDTEGNRKRLKLLFVRLAVISLLCHLSAIFLARTFPSLLPGLLEKTGTNYLQAVYTPFSFILFYEVVLLVFALSLIHI